MYSGYVLPPFASTVPIPCQYNIGVAVAQGLVTVEGDAAKVGQLFDLLDEFPLMFDVVEPRRDG